VELLCLDNPGSDRLHRNVNGAEVVASGKTCSTKTAERGKKVRLEVKLVGLPDRKGKEASDSAEARERSANARRTITMTPCQMGKPEPVSYYGSRHLTQGTFV
jgi:hypothetical protein